MMAASALYFEELWHYGVSPDSDENRQSAGRGRDNVHDFFADLNVYKDRYKRKK